MAKVKAKVKAKAKAKRYTDAQKKEILDFIEAKGRGGQTIAVKKFKVTAATIGSWKKKSVAIQHHPLLPVAHQGNSKLFRN